MTKAQPSERVALLVNAQPRLRRRDLDSEDRLIPGVHVVYVNTAVGFKHLANAALDIFHSRVAVSELDDFQFDVVDARDGQVLRQAGDVDGYAFSDEGDYGALAQTQPLEIATVSVRAGRDTEGELDLGKVTVAGSDWAEIERRATELLWDERLRTTGYVPVCERAEPAQAQAATPGERQR